MYVKKRKYGMGMEQEIRHGMEYMVTIYLLIFCHLFLGNFAAVFSLRICAHERAMFF